MLLRPTATAPDTAPPADIIRAKVASMTLELTESSRQLAILRAQLKQAKKTLTEQVDDAAADKKASIFIFFLILLLAAL